VLFDEVSEEKEKLWFGLNLRRALRIGQALSLMQIALASLHNLNLQRSCIVLLPNSSHAQNERRVQIE